MKQGSASKYLGGFLLQSFWGTSAPTQSHLFYTQPFQIMLEPESYLCDLLNWKSICCQWSNKLLLIFSIGGYSQGAFWYVFFIKSLFRKKKKIRTQVQQKKYSCRVLREKKIKEVWEWLQRKETAKHKIAAPPMIAQKCKGSNTHRMLLWTPNS